MATRRAGKAGSWYPGVPAELEKEVALSLGGAEAFLEKLPASGRSSGRPAAIVVPHAGLAFSGGIAAAAFKIVREALDRVDCFLVFGASHRMRLARPAVWAEGEWETPLGPVRVDAEAAGALLAAGLGEANEAPHLDDNAIELETPFIKSMFPEAAMVPVAMDFFADSWRIGEQAALALRASAGSGDRVVLAVASTDLTHYGAGFGVMPAGAGEPALAWTRRNDARFLDALRDMRLEDIVPVASRDGSACGAGAAAAAAGWAKALGSERGRILAYATSHDVAPSGPAEHFVGYASMIYEAAGDGKMGKRPASSAR